MNQRLLLTVVAVISAVIGTPSVSRAQAVNEASINSLKTPVENAENLTRDGSSNSLLTKVHADKIAGLPPELTKTKPQKKVETEQVSSNKHHTKKFATKGRGFRGMASFYGNYFAGKKTASGERFNPARMTAAHRSLPFGTRVRVTNMRNGRSVVVRINDRGPFIRGRVIDLSKGAARVIKMVGRGVAPVRVQVLGR